MFAGYLGLSTFISSQFTLEMCTAAENHKRSIKTLYFRSLVSFKVIGVDTIKNLVTSASYDKQHVRAYLQLFLR